MFDYRLKLLQYYNINKSTKNVRTVLLGGDLTARPEIQR